MNSNINNIEKSLLAKLDRKCSDKQKLKIILDLAAYYFENREYYLCIDFANQALQLAEDSGQQKAIIKSCFFIGKSNIFVSHYDTAMEYLSRCLNLAREKKDREYIQKALNAIGTVYSITQDYQQALDCFQNLIKFDGKNAVAAYHNIGNLYRNCRDYEKALEYFNKSYNTAVSNSSSKQGGLITKIEIALAYYEMKDYAKALQFLEECLSDIKECENPDISMYCDIYIGLAKTLIGTNDIKKALEYLAEAEKFVEETNDTRIKIVNYSLLSETYEELTKYDKAIIFCRKYANLSQSVFNTQLSHNLAKLQDSFQRTKQEMEADFNKILSDTKKEMSAQLKNLQMMYKDIVGLNYVVFFSDSMNSILALTQKLHKNRNIPVLIEGETGSGKEIIAKLIHFEKEDSTTPFISINCSAISPSLFESELFGYESGAFTGAKSKGSQGKLELAQGGTIFLDEIGDMPIEMQPKLLRVLDEKMFYRVGGLKKVNLNVRFICATNHNLLKLIDEGKFRSDLYYRLNSGYIKVPPLRERKEEIIPLSIMFLNLFSEQMKKKFVSISKDAELLLCSQDWKGNVRELKNTIERAVMLFDDVELKKQHLINEFTFNEKSWQSDTTLYVNMSNEKLSLAEIETEIIKQVLQRFGGNKTKTAEYLNITRMTLNNKLK